MARDIFHEAVRHALEREGWRISADPLTFTFPGKVTLQIDLGAERVLALERGLERIAVEVKTFVGLSQISELHSAIGQYRNYLSALDLRDPHRRLFLAVPVTVFNTFFQLEFVRYTLQRNQVNVLVYDPETEVIVSWHESQTQPESNTSSGLS
jgi:XisH protein